MNKMTKKSVGIWIRVSTEDQARGESPEHHEERAKFYAKSKGWLLKETYHLEGVSGKTVFENTETKRMIEDIRSGHISGLIFSKLARLARNTRELLEFADIFQDNEADLISLQESIDTSSPAGRLFYTMIAAMAEWERSEISDRVAASVPIRAKLGKPLGGAAPYGYAWDHKELVINEEEAPVRRLMYELFLKYKRKKTVCSELNKAGHRTRSGANFSDTTVGRLLTDPIAKGLRRANYTESTGQNKQWKLKPKEDWVFVPAPAIVSDEIWDKCNAILDSQLKKYKRPSKKATHLFTGHIYCHCGTRMYVPTNSRKYTCTDCKNKVHAEDLAEVFHNRLKQFVFSDEEINGHVKQVQKSLSNKEKIIIKLQKESKQVQDKMDSVMDLYHEGKIKKKSFNKHYQPYYDRSVQIDEQIPKLQAEIDSGNMELHDKNQILTDAQDLYTQWPRLDSEARRAIVENILERITVGKKDLVIRISKLSHKDYPLKLTRNGNAPMRIQLNR